MRRAALFVVSALLFCVAGVLLSLNGCGGGNTVTIPPFKIQHVVVIFQENRTPDNLFQDPALIKNGADIQNYGVNSKGQTISLSPIDFGHGRLQSPELRLEPYAWRIRENVRPE
jgi:hypothetical protein